MASTWTATWRRFLSPFTVGAKAGGGLSAGVKAVVLGGVLPFSRGRLISTCSVLWMRRRKFNPNPDGVPKWANYDGNQKCIDGGEDEDRLIWEGYKRNHKGQLPPKRTRKRCIRGKSVCGNPCPICARGLTVDYKNVSLISQFVCPHTDQILSPYRTGLCRQQQKKVEEAVEKARDYGYLPFTVPRKLPEEELRTPEWNKIDIH